MGSILSSCMGRQASSTNGSSSTLGSRLFLPVDVLGLSHNRTIDGEPTMQEKHAFLDSAKRYDFARVQALVLENPRYVNCQANGRWSALHQAAHVGDASALRFLLAHGASISVLTMDGRTPLEVANPNVFDILLDLLPTQDIVDSTKPNKASNCASDATIARLHLSKFTSSKSDGEASSDAEHVVCEICLDEFSEGDELHTLPCCHFFHTDCIDVWLRERNSTCPVCRREVK